MPPEVTFVRYKDGTKDCKYGNVIPDHKTTDVYTVKDLTTREFEQLRDATFKDVDKIIDNYIA